MKHEQGMVQVVLAVVLLIIGAGILFFALGGIEKLQDTALQIEQERTNQGRYEYLKELAFWQGQIGLKYAEQAGLRNAMTLMMPYVVLAVFGLAVAGGIVATVFGPPPWWRERTERITTRRHPSFATDEEADAALVKRTGRVYQQEEAKE